MNEFTYALVRYVPDPDRMEPINVGIILQGQGRIDLQLYPHVAKRKEIDTQVFQQWRAFLRTFRTSAEGFLGDYRMLGDEVQRP